MEKKKFENIRNIIFDLGGVLIDLDFLAPVRAFAEMGLIGKNLDYRTAIKDPLFQKFETGDITTSQFRTGMRQIIGGGNITDDQLDAAWCSIMDTIPPEKTALLKNLGHHHRLFLFSNTNTIHINWFLKRFEEENGFPLESLFERCFYSHIIRDRKPLISSFEKVIRLGNMRVEETLFVDDFVENIAAAREFGLQTIHYHPGTDLAGHFPCLAEK